MFIEKHIDISLFQQRILKDYIILLSYNVVCCQRKRIFFINGDQREIFFVIPYVATKAGNICVQMKGSCFLLQIHML